MTNFEDVAAFNERFGLSYKGPPKSLDEQTAAYRILFMQEELQEYIDAYKTKDLSKQFDALLDLVYVAMGTALFHGFPWQEGWDEVQRANMTKIRATSPEESKRGSELDVIKPPDWRGPDLAEVLKKAAAPRTSPEIDDTTGEGFDDSD